jgi:hypothetical protein
VTAAVKKEREGYVDVRVAAYWLVRAFDLDVSTLEDDRRRAPHAPLTRIEREKSDKNPDERKLSKAERARLEKALDAKLVYERRDDGECVGVTELAHQVMLEALLEVPTSPGQRPELVLSRARVTISDAKSIWHGMSGDAVSPTAKAAIAKRYPQPPNTRGRQRRRPGMRSTLRKILLDVVYPWAKSRAPKATVYLLFVLLGPGPLEVIFGDAREGDTATAYLDRATKTLDNILRDRSGD